MQRPNALFGLSPQNFSQKNFLTFFPKKPALKKFLIFSGNRNPLKILIFQETKMEVSYISGKVYSEP